VQALPKTQEGAARGRKRVPRMAIDHTAKLRIGDQTRGIVPVAVAPVTMVTMTRAREEVIMTPKEREDNVAPVLSIFLSNPPF